MTDEVRAPAPLTIEQLEAMTPEQRKADFQDRIVHDLGQDDPASLERIIERTRHTLDRVQR